MKPQYHAATARRGEYTMIQTIQCVKCGKEFALEAATPTPLRFRVPSSDLIARSRTRSYGRRAWAIASRRCRASACKSLTRRLRPPLRCAQGRLSPPRGRGYDSRGSGSILLRGRILFLLAPQIAERPQAERLQERVLLLLDQHLGSFFRRPGRRQALRPVGNPEGGKRHERYITR